MATSIGVKMQMDGAAQFKADLQQITQKSKELAAEMKAAASGEADFAKRQQILGAQIENAAAKIDKLNQKYSQQERQLEETKAQLEEAKQAYGEDSAEAQKLTLAVTKQETALSKTKTEINKATDELNKLEAQTEEGSDGMQKFGKETQDAGNKVKDSEGKFSSAANVIKNVGAAVGAAVVAIGTAAVALGKKLVDSAVDVSAYGDEIDKESQKLGMSAENYQKLSYAMEMSGADIESMKKGMVNINKSLADFADGNEAAASSFTSLGVSLKNGDGSMKNSEAVLMDTVDALANMEDATKRDAMAQEIFGKSFTELRPLLNSGSEGIRELMEEAEAYGMVMSDDAVKASADFDDSLTRAQGTMQGLKNRMVGELLPAFGEVVDGFSLLVSGQDTSGEALAQGIEHSLDAINQVLPKLVKVGGTIVKGLVNGISKNLPQILSGALEMVQTLMDAIVDNIPLIAQAIGTALPQMIEAFVKVVEGIAQNFGAIITPLLDALPQIVDAVVSALPSIITAILAALPDIIRGLVKAIPAIIDAILSALPDIILAIIQALPQIVIAIITELPKMAVEIAKAIITNFPKIIVAIAQGLWSILSQIGEWFGGLFSSLGTWLAQIGTDVWNFIKSIPGKIGEGLRGIYDAGLNLVKGLWDGISDAADWVLGKIKGFGEKILNGIKSFFGIKSPSREMAWVGRMLDEGLAKGISQYSGVALTEAFSVADGISGAMNGLQTPRVSIGTGGSGYGSTTNAVTMNIYGAEGQSINDLADEVIDKLQRTIMGSEAVYA